MLEIDGSILEGGGQTLRTATSLSVITQKPCRVFRIREKRENSGLAQQHLLGLQALAKLSGSSLQGDELQSKEIKLYPSNKFQKSVTIKIPTAASITLIMQTLVPLSLILPFPVEIDFDGGATDTFFSPTLNYFQNVFLTLLKNQGIKAEIETEKKGYYPEGGAKIKLKLFPSKLKTINLIQRGQLKKVIIISEASQTLKDQKIAERQITGAKEILGKINLPLEERESYYQASCPGSSIAIIAQFENTTIGTDNLGKLGKRAEDVGKEAALNLLSQEKIKACLDKNMVDQILIYMALCSKKAAVTIPEATEHCKTCIKIIETFFRGRFSIKDDLIVWQP